MRSAILLKNLFAELTNIWIDCFRYIVLKSKSGLIRKMFGDLLNNMLCSSFVKRLCNSQNASLILYIMCMVQLRWNTFAVLSVPLKVGSLQHTNATLSPTLGSSVQQCYLRFKAGELILFIEQCCNDTGLLAIKISQLLT